MKILALANAPWCSSGYGRQADAFIRQMRHLGHEVAIVANYGLANGIQEHNGVKVYPKLSVGQKGYGSESLAKWAKLTHPDLVMTFMDAWVTESGLFQDWLWVPHFPIDVDPCPKGLTKQVEGAVIALVYSKWGADVARRHNVKGARYMPLTIDASVYKPGDKAAARKELGWPQDAFIPGMVAANVGNVSRKCFIQNIEAFARFHKRHTDSILYLHTDITGPMDGINLKPLIEYLGIGKSVMAPNPLAYEVGLTPDRMALVYQALDMLVASTASEGFGLPIIEAQACGTPALTGDWTAMSELTFHPSRAMPKSQAEPFWWLLDGYWHIPHIDAIDAWIEHFYNYVQDPIQHEIDDMVRRVQEFDELVVADKMWRPLMGEIGNILRGKPSAVDEVAAAMLKR